MRFRESLKVQRLKKGNLVINEIGDQQGYIERERFNVKKCKEGLTVDLSETSFYDRRVRDRGDSYECVPQRLKPHSLVQL